MSDSSGQNSGQENGLGVAALILGIISLVGGFLPFLAALLLGIWPPLTAIGSILAIIFVVAVVIGIFVAAGK